MVSALDGAIPVTVITGFLGAGKTTLVRALIGRPELARSAVIVNEYGAAPIDHALLETSSERIEMLDGGCICCSVRGDLDETLVKLFARRRAGDVMAFERVIIETSGLADPAPILHTLMRSAALARAYRLDGVVALVDALHGAGTLDRHPEAVKQAAIADRLLVTKADLADAAAVAALHARLAELNPNAPQATAAHGAVDPGFITGIAPLARPGRVATGWLGQGSGDGAPLQREAVRHTAGLQSFTLVYDAPFTRERLGVWLDTLARLRGADLLRVKGLVEVAGVPGPVAIHAVQHVQSAPVALAAWPDADRRSRIVFITRGIDRQAVEGLLAGLTALDNRATAGR